MVSPPRHPRGQQRDKIYREALRLELADMSEGVDLKKLREIARTHIEKAAAGDMQAIKELRDTLDGKPVQQLEHGVPEETGIEVVWKIMHVYPETSVIEGECAELPSHRSESGNGQG
jgi:hypothetical protein